MARPSMSVVVHAATEMENHNSITTARHQIRKVPTASSRCSTRHAMRLCYVCTVSNVQVLHPIIESTFLRRLSNRHSSRPVPKVRSLYLCCSALVGFREGNKYTYSMYLSAWEECKFILGVGVWSSISDFRMIYIFNLGSSQVAHTPWQLKINSQYGNLIFLAKSYWQLL